MTIECEGYKNLLAAVEHDEQQSPNMHDYRAKLAWILDRAQHYAEKTGLKAAEILDAWEKRRSYWYMNFYQECNQPEIKGDEVRVFDSLEDFKNSIGKAGFRCPKCEGVSQDPYKCNASKDCDWKAYGLFGTLGKGVHVFVGSELCVEELFMPIAWENNGGNHANQSRG